MLSRRKFVKLAAPALVTLPFHSRRVRAAFSAAQSSNHVPGRYPCTLDPTKTYLEDQFGDPCLAIGDDASDAWVMLSAAQIDQYLQTRRQMGYNIVWITAVDNLVQSNPEANAEGNFPFSSAKSFTGFQTPYWNKVDYAMQRALYWGLTVLFMPVFNGTSAADGYWTSFYNLPTATIQAYAAFLVNLLGKYPNLIWLLGGDSDPVNSALATALNTLAVAIKAIDGHLMTMEAARHIQGGSLAPNGGLSSADFHIAAYGSVQSWLDLNWIYQSFTTTLSGAQRCFQQNGLPGIYGEGGYELETSETTFMTGALTRAQAWFSTLGGGTLGSVGGNGAVWSFNAPNGSPCCTSGTPTWQSQLSSVGAVAQQLMANALRSREFWKLAPDKSGVVMTSNTGGAGTAACARASDGRAILTYASQQTLTFDMSKITDAGSQVLARWYDPATGAVRAAGLFPNSGSQTFTVPSDLSDAVLDLVSPAAGFRPPGT